MTAEYNSYRREWRRRPDVKLRARQKYLNARYGIDTEKFDLLAADGCMICGGRVLVQKQEFLHVDHVESPRGKRVRGVLCKNCNTGIGLFHHVPEFLILAARYLLSDEESESV